MESLITTHIAIWREGILQRGKQPNNPQSILFPLTSGWDTPVKDNPKAGMNKI